MSLSAVGLDVDLGGITRQITRDDRPAAVLAVEPEPRTWAWALEHLVAPDSYCRARIVDTAVMKGALEAWYHTSAEGAITTRLQAYVTADTMVQAFGHIALAYARNRHRVFAVAHTGESGGVAQMLYEADVKRSLLRGAGVVCAFVPPRGGGPGYANFRHEYSIYTGSMDPSPVCASYRYSETPSESRARAGASRAAKMEQPTSTIRLRDPLLARLMDAMTKEVVTFLEATARVKVTTFVADYVLDDNGCLWLVRALDPILAVSKTKFGLYAACPEQQSRAAFHAAANATAGTLNRLRGNSLTRSGSPIVLTHVRRTGATSPPSRDAERSPGPSPSYERPSARSRVTATERAARRTVEDFDRVGQSQLSLRDEAAVPVPVSVPGFARPARGGTLAFGAEMGSAGEALGSTQSSGCAGDFCDVDSLTAADSDALYATTKGVLSSAEYAAVTASRGGGSGPTRVDPVMFRIPFIKIAQARAESQLVRAYLLHLRRGEMKDYADSKYSSRTEALERGHPAAYYRTAHVCGNCFRVYTKIEDARRRAVAKYSGVRPSISVALRTVAEGRRAPTAGGGAPDWATNAIHAESMPAMMGVSAASTTRGAPASNEAACLRADAALHALSIADITELRAYKFPPPQVQLIVTGLTIMLTGEALSWPDARRLLATDRLIAAINAFDRDSFPRARLRTLIPLMSNPAIHPDAVAPVCRAAAGLAAWILATVQCIAESGDESELRASLEQSEFLRATTAGTRTGTGFGGPRTGSGGLLGGRGKPGRSHKSSAEDDRNQEQLPDTQEATAARLAYARAYLAANPYSTTTTGFTSAVSASTPSLPALLPQRVDTR